MLSNFLFALWIFLPAGIANVIPILVSKLPKLKDWEYPLDFYKEFRGVRIFGDHKTIRGLVFGILASILLAYLQKDLYLNSPWLQSVFQVNYENIDPFFLGLLSGFGALMGDAVKSFFKRRSAIKPGEKWFPFDQIDYIAGGLIFITPYVRISPEQYLWIILSYFFLHLLISYIGYLLKLKKSPI